MLIEMMLEQGTQEWLDFRKAHRMASETPAIMGVSPYQKQHDIRRIKNNGAGQFVNYAMRQGTAQEPIARLAYENKYDLMRPAVYKNGEYGASLDGINMDKTGIWECKVPVDGFDSERAKMAKDNILLPHDYAQVQHQLMVTGAEWCHFCVWDAHKQDFILAHVDPDTQYWELIDTAWNQFWDTLGLRNDKVWLKAVKDYLVAGAQVTLCEEKYDNAKKVLHDLLTGDSNEGGGVRVQRSQIAGKVDWKKVQEHLKLDEVFLKNFRTLATVQIKINKIKE